ncbi:MAG: 50S ribosomal protein L18 [Candidatus Pacebacteria bacterium]|nr:50S ribosomal protein L18 [Candidatus Paceibacterota bacterium]
MLTKQEKRIKRHRSVRAKIAGSEKRPRVCVFRSNSHIYAQIIDDVKKVTILAANDSEMKAGKKSKVELAKAVGLALAVKAGEKKITEIIFDRGGYKYHGRVKALAEGLREGGLKF